MNANSPGLKLAPSKHRSAVIRFRQNYSATNRPPLQRFLGTRCRHHLRTICMINPNNDDITRDEPLPTPLESSEGEFGSGGREQFRRTQNKISTAMTHTWEGTKEKAGRARDRTEYFVRENPMPTILGALGLGIAVGLAIRYATEPKTEVGVKSPLGNVDWSRTFLSLPLLWPFL